MNHHPHRLGLLAGLFATPLVALAQEDLSTPPLPIEDTRHGPASWLTALNIGLRGHAIGMDEGLAKTPALTVNMEQQLLPHFTVYGGPHAGLDFNAIGVQVGSRVFFSEQSFHGFFVSAQASYTLFEVDDHTDATRRSLAGLVGYAHPLGKRWLVSLSAGAQSTHTRTETTSPPELCFAWFCSGSDIEDKVEHDDAVEPLVQMGATFRF